MEKKTSIFNLGLEFVALKDILDNPVIDEETGEILDDTDTFNQLFSDLTGDIDAKLDGAMYIIKEYKAKTDALDLEIKRLQAMKTASKNNGDRLKQRIFELINLMEDKKHKTDLHSFGIRKSESVNIISDENIPREYFKITKVVDKASIKKALKNGVEFDGVAMQENYSLSVR